MGRLYILALLFLTLLVCQVSAQIPNASFETFDTVTIYDEPISIATTNYRSLTDGWPLTVFEVNGEENSAMRLMSYNERGGVFVGQAVNFTNDLNHLGEPYVDQPTAVAISYKSAIVAGDTAVCVFSFLKDGDVLHEREVYFHSTTSGYVTDTFDFDSFTEAPDTLIVQYSANVVAVPQLLSTLDIDRIEMIGGAQITNADFTDWERLTVNDPEGWESESITTIIGRNPPAVAPSLEATDGEFSVKILTAERALFLGGGITGFTVVETGRRRNYLPIDFNPIALTGTYKFESDSVDQGAIVVVCGGINPGTGEFVEYPPAVLPLEEVADFESFKLDLSFPEPVDSFIIGIAADVELFTDQSPRLGNILWIDDLSFDFSTSTRINTNYKISAYPNPARDILYLSGTHEIEAVEGIYILDALGRVVSTVSQSDWESGQIMLSNLNSGTHFLMVKTTSEKAYHLKFVKE